MTRPSHNARSGRGAVALVVPVLVALAALAAGVCLNAADSPVWHVPVDLAGETLGTSSHTSGIMIIAIPLLVAWAASLYRRCTDLSLRGYFVWMGVLCTTWLLDVTVKYTCSNDLLSSLLWYYFYVPMAILPLMCLFVALRMAFYIEGKGIRLLKCIAMLISVAFIVLVFTNNLHHQVFVFDFSNPGWGGDYGYEWGYWAFTSWTIVLYVAFFALLIRIAHLRLRGMFAPAVIVGLLALAYAVLYVLRVGNLFTSNFSLTYVIMFSLCIELLFRFGLLPSFSDYREAFDGLPFDAKILASDLSVKVETEGASALGQDAMAAIGSLGCSGGRRLSFKVDAQPDLSYEAVGLRGGIALFIEDRTSVNARRREIERASEAAKSRIAVLENSVAVEGELCRLESERKLLDMIDEQLGATVDVITELLDSISGQTTPEERRRTLAFVRLLVGYCKRMGAFVLSGTDNGEFDSERLALVLGDTAADARASGISCASFVAIESPLPKGSVLMLYDCMYDILTIAFQYASAVVMFSLLEKNGDAASFSAMLEVAGEKEFTGSETAERLRASLSQHGVSYDLSFDEETLHVSMILPRQADSRGGGA